MTKLPKLSGSQGRKRNRRRFKDRDVQRNCNVRSRTQVFQRSFPLKLNQQNRVCLKEEEEEKKKFSFVYPWIRYFLVFYSFFFWVFSLLIVVIDTVRNTFLIDPAVILIVVGVVMFFITFCGCIGALRENLRLLKTFSFSLTLVILTPLAIAILGFFSSDQVSADSMCIGWVTSVK